MLKAFKYRLLPNPEQEVLLAQHFGACRWLYNTALALGKSVYKAEKRTVTRFQLDKMLPDWKREFPWLSDINSQALQQTLAHLEAAYQRFFKNKRGFPKFKKKGDSQSFSCPQSCTVDFEQQTIKLPKIGKVALLLSRGFQGVIKTVTVSKTATGKYFASVLVEDGLPEPIKQEIVEETAVGIDVGLKDFATLSNGKKIANPRLLKKSAARLRRLQKALARKKQDSNNRAKAKKKLALLHERVANQRQDFLHQTSTQLVRESQAALCVETLKVTNLLKNKRLAKAIADAGWGEFFRQLKYKAAWRGKSVLHADRFAPTSQICFDCGGRKSDLVLSDREWTCQDCGACHDRDVNAAKNIVTFAFEKYRGDTRKSKSGDRTTAGRRSAPPKLAG